MRFAPWVDSWHSCVRRADADRHPAAERCGLRAAEADGGRGRTAGTGGGRVRTAATGGGGCVEGGRGAGAPGPPTPPAAGPPAGPERPRS
jgi:hypothetical protein